MLETVEAVRYVKEMRSGRNIPLVLEVQRANGDMLEAVVKLATAECGPGGLIREAMAAMLAADLGLPVAEPFVVTADAQFTSTLLSPAMAARFDPKVPAFGCALVEGMQRYIPGMPLTNALTNCAGRTFAFDGAIQNQDRLPTKANCLTNGLELLLIDHELSLNLHGRGGILAPDPWQAGAMLPMTMGPTEHLFFRQVKGLKTDYPAMLEKLAMIPKTRIAEFVAAIPPEWNGDDLVDEIAIYLSDLIDNAALLSSELESMIA